MNLLEELLSGLALSCECFHTNSSPLLLDTNERRSEALLMGIRSEENILFSLQSLYVISEITALVTPQLFVFFLSLHRFPQQLCN